MPHQKTNPEMNKCIDTCLECADICVRCSTHCLSMGGEHAGVEHQTIMHDCADICATAARFMGRASAHHAHVCRECSDICAACAEACEGLAGGDEMMTECAATCRRCADECERMASAAV